MTDVDIFAKLSRILETSNLGDDEDEDSVVELLKQIGKNGTEEKTIGTSLRKPKSAKATAADAAASTHRPTPYEVWQAKESGKFTFEERQAPQLSEQQWDRLVNGLHRTTKIKESATKEQNQGLAHELGGLSFRPKMNAASLVLASTMKSLHERLPGMINARDMDLKKKREENNERELAGCTFKPFREGAKTSEKYLKKIGRKEATPDDFLRYQEEKLRRNEQRKLIIDEIDSKELTFKPQLNAKSLKLQEKLLTVGKIDIDPISRQTVITASPIIKKNEERSAYHPEESFHPEITSRAKTYRSNLSGTVHDRLYTRAMKQKTEFHNAQVELFQSKVALPTKPWEAPRSKDVGGQAWTQVTFLLSNCLSAFYN